MNAEGKPNSACSAFIVPHSGLLPVPVRDEAQRAEQAGELQRLVTIDAAGRAGVCDACGVIHDSE